VSASPAPSPPPTSAPASRAFGFERELATPVRAIGLGNGRTVGVLADEPHIRDASGFRERPLPSPLRARDGETERVGIWFGRDNRARIMGTRTTPQGDVSVYLRWKEDGWKDGKEEIGALASTKKGGLYGLLGDADPELVCRYGSVCIIKRRSGWTIFPAGPEPTGLLLHEGTIFALEPAAVSVLDVKGGWSPLAANPPWTAPKAFWTDGTEIWVATSAPDELFHYEAGAWSTGPSPIAAPKGFWGARREQVWLVGDGGAAFFDGKGWTKADDVSGPLSIAIGRETGEVWLGGEAGLFSASR
jgi:hypothetical protein